MTRITQDLHFEQYREAQERRSMTTDEKVMLRCTREFVSDLVQAFSVASILCKSHYYVTDDV